MRLIVLTWFLCAICIAMAPQSHAQVCSGSKGDPVFKEDFGSGQNPGPPLASGITSLKDTVANCPSDGYYTIANSITGAGNCHPPTWFNVPYDHTGNPNGYMMIINASNLPSIFYTQQVNGLCPGTNYVFQTYVLNLNYTSLITNLYTQPNITITVKTKSGKLLNTITTGNLVMFSYNQGYQWVPIGMSFTTPANSGDIVFEMTNNSNGGNGNDFIMDDITISACGALINLGFGSPVGQQQESVCQGTNVNYMMQAALGGGGNAVFQWQVNTGTGWNDIAGQTGSNYTISMPNAVAGTYQYRVGMANGTSSSPSCRIYSQVVTLNVEPPPDVPAFSPQTVCIGNTLKLTASGGASYIWTKPDLTTTTQNPLVISNASLTDAGNYSVIAFSDANCPSQPVPVTVTVLPQIVPSISSDVEICAGQSTQLSAGGGLFYSWSPSTGLSDPTVANPVAAPLKTTIYTVQIGNGGCSALQSLTVTVDQLPVAKAGSNINVFEGSSAKLDGKVTGDNIISYTWTPSTFLDNPNSLTPVTTPTENITYTLTVVSKNCGVSTSSIFVRVYKKITIPNAFSPNNDGINDYWDINQLNTYADCSLMVYNRYGEKVFQSTGYGKPWDGRYGGSPLPNGTYYYIIDLKNDTPKIAGWVLIVR